MLSTLTVSRKTVGVNRPPLYLKLLKEEAEAILPYDMIQRKGYIRGLYKLAPTLPETRPGLKVKPPRGCLSVIFCSGLRKIEYLFEIRLKSTRREREVDDVILCNLSLISAIFWDNKILSSLLSEDQARSQQTRRYDYSWLEYHFYTGTLRSNHFVRISTKVQISYEYFVKICTMDAKIGIVVDSHILCVRVYLRCSWRSYIYGIVRIVWERILMKFYRV